MATKTISIDLDAYDRLRAVRRDQESFSETIKRVVRKPMSPDEVVRLFRDHALSPQAAAAVKRTVARRGRGHSRSGRRGVS